MTPRRTLLLLSAAIVAARPALAGPELVIVAAENFYADIAARIAGPEATVSAILSNPGQDPHLFEASPSVARRLREARIVIENGAGYDPWMRRLRAGGDPDQRVIEVAALLGRREGENPHVWYDPRTMPRLAARLTELLSEIDPAHASDYQARLAALRADLAPLERRVAELRARFAGTAVTATEPVFDDMAAALGLSMRNARFQLAVQNGTEPRPSDVAAFEADLRGRRVRALIVNAQAGGGAAARMADVARKSGVPVIAMTETMPPGTDYIGWMQGQLDRLARALGAP